MRMQCFAKNQLNIAIHDAIFRAATMLACGQPFSAYTEQEIKRLCDEDPRISEVVLRRLEIVQKVCNNWVSRFVLPTNIVCKFIVNITYKRF